VGVTLRGLRMFEQVQVPILGIVENMSTFVCPHCGKETEVFRHGGAGARRWSWGCRFWARCPSIRPSPRRETPDGRW